MAGLQLITPPSAEPVALADAYDYARVTVNDDTLMSSLITAARRYCEKYTRRQFITATWLYTLDAFYGSFVGPGYDSFRHQAPLPQTIGSFPFGVMAYPYTALNLPLPPLQEINSIQYIDPTGAAQTLASSLYVVDTVSEAARLMPSFGNIWPPTRPILNAVQITFTAGYGAAAAVPQEAVTAIKLIVTHWWDHRHAVSDKLLQTVPLAANALLDSLRYGNYV